MKKNRVYCIDCQSFDNYHGEHQSCWESRVNQKSPIFPPEKGGWDVPYDPYLQNKNNDCKYFRPYKKEEKNDCICRK